MPRVIQPEGRYASEEIQPGVFLETFFPGGVNGPNGEILFETPGGQTWSEMILIGEPSDPFQMALPDIRMPANQYWPLHWHDCWTVVLIVEGQCLIGDWWMQPGDIFIAEPSIEYGPLVVGPKGCRLFEIFARLHLSPGGYAPEFSDHPTLQTVGSVFKARSDVNRRNDGRQTLPLDGVGGMVKTRLTPGATWDLGDPGDPDRGLMACTRLAPGERRPDRTYNDWSAIVPTDGEARVGGRTLGRDDFLLIRPGSRLEDIVAGPAGADLLELNRTARA